MKFFYKSRIWTFLSIAFAFGLSNQSFAQCSIVGLNDTYCIDADPIFLAGSPSGGTFAGPGVTDGVFDPADAGIGVHTIEYTFVSGSDRYYVHSTVGDPWGNTSNNTAMDNAFGPGEWILEFFETVDVDAMFSVNTSFVFLDGSDDNATELNAFLIANLVTIEAWVDGGGVILINSAPNEGSDMDFGFDGTTLDYSVYPSSVTGVDPSHPAFLGPITPTSTSMTGSSYSHARIIGTGYTDVLVNGGDVHLCEKDWGSGHVMMGTMTTVNFHGPSPHAANFRANLFTYLDEYVVSGVVCTVTQDVEVLDESSPDVIASADVEEICLGGSYTVTGSGADDFYWGGSIVDGEANTPDAAGTYTHLLTGVSPSGCVGTDEVTVIVHPIPFVEAGFDQAQCAGMELTLSGTGAETYSWSPSITDGEPFVVTEGETTYTVTGTDANGCEDTDEVVITGVGYPSVTADITHEFADFNGAIDITVTGGSGSYAYMWSHGPTTEDVSGLGEGMYTVVVDDIGVEDGICPDVEETFEVLRFVGVEDLAMGDLNVYPTPATDNVTIAFTGAFKYELTALNGDIIFNGNAVDQEIINVEELAAGAYLINVYAAEKMTVKIIKQ